MNTLEAGILRALTFKDTTITASFNGCTGTTELQVVDAVLLNGLQLPLLGRVPIMVIPMPSQQHDLMELLEEIARIPTIEIRALSARGTAVIATDEAPKVISRGPAASRNSRIHLPHDRRFQAGNYLNPVVPPHIMRRG